MKLNLSEAHKLRHWLAPNYISVGEDWSIPLKEVPESILSEWCDHFRADVFRNAGYIDSRAEKRDTNV